MAFTYEAGGDLSTGGKFLNEPGIYQLFITSIDEQPTNRKGELIDNAAFRVDLEVLAGTVEGQKNKITDLLFFNPKPGDKNEGAHAKKLLDRFFLATAMKSEAELAEKGKQVAIELSDLIGRQFFAKFALEKEENSNKEHLRLNFYDMWHVDDDAVKGVPRDEKALGLIDPALRRIGAKKAPEKKPVETAKRETAAAGSAKKSWSDL